LGGFPWQLEQDCADTSTLPLMCSEAFFQVELAPLNAAITSPWQLWQAVVEDECEPLFGGLAWQALPQASCVPSTLFQTGACPTLLDRSVILAPWQ
jgi:hypothetical protein